MPDPGEVGRGAGKSRVFFALWPDSEVRKRFHALGIKLHARLGGRHTQADTLHLTLVFVGEVDDALLAPTQDAAARVSVPAFEMAFDRLDCWRHNHIAHVGLTQTPPALFDLVEKLSRALKAAGIPFDARPYKAHVTLLRKADCGKFREENENPAPEPIRWSARDFVLVKSSLGPGGARYEQLARWPLP